MNKDSLIRLAPKWVNCQSFEESLFQSFAPQGQDISKIMFCIPEGCKIKIDAGVRLLSLVNQLAFTGKKVTLDFKEAETGTMGYLNRMGFFDYLDNNVEVLPHRPLLSGAKMYHGTNTNLVEFACINPNRNDRDLPKCLADALEKAVHYRRDHKSLGMAAYTVFAELIDNIFQHSSTKLDGFAALQVYKNGGRALVVVSDSGEGLLHTLRPVINVEFPRLKDISDSELVVEAFRRGLSRHGTSRGCGLRRSAEQAIKYNAELDVRLPKSRVRLMPSQNGYSTADCYEGLPLIWGSHICFDFLLDM